MTPMKIEGLGTILVVEIPVEDRRRILDANSENLSVDKMAAQIGQFALSRLVLGDSANHAATGESPTAGHTGVLKGYRIVVKTSVVRGRRKLWGDYLLAVRPREFRDVAFVLALCRPAEWRLALVGWAIQADLPSERAEAGTNKGAFVLRAARLRPIETLDPDEFRLP